MARGVVWTGPVKRIAVAVLGRRNAARPAGDAGLRPDVVAAEPFGHDDVGGPGPVGRLDYSTSWRSTPPASTSRPWTRDRSRRVTQSIGARAVWSQHDASGKAVTGQGVTVAVLDSGVESVPGLDGAGKVIQGPDLSLEANSDLDRGQDTYGHGTFMAGIIAAQDPVTLDKTGKPTGMTPSTQLGVAPGAHILAVKAATADGSTDVSEIIAGLDWIVAHRNDNGMNVRVVNLSFGTDSVQSYQLDPLAEAAENAWRHGIVVVASAGNEGNNAGAAHRPGDGPVRARRRGDRPGPPGDRLAAPQRRDASATAATPRARPMSSRPASPSSACATPAPTSTPTTPRAWSSATRASGCSAAAAPRRPRPSPVAASRCWRRLSRRRRLTS